MPSFRYRAISDGGDTLDGLMEASDREAVIASLHAAGNLPVRVEPALGPAAAHRRFSRHGISQKDVANLTRELATLLGAGLPLDRSLEILADTGAREKVNRLLARVLEKIMAGKSFADALEAQQGAFSKIYINMVRAGESSGSLEAVLERLADYMQKSRELRDSVISTMIYPAILLAFAGISLAILLTQVVPQFSILFEQAGAALPTSTRIVIAVSDWLIAYWWGLALGLLGALLALDFAIRNPRARIHLDRVILVLPLIGGLARKIEVARFARTFGTLLHNGVNPVAALAIVKDTMGNLILARGIDALSERLKEGQGIAGPLRQEGQFPTLAVQMIQVGEETGRLEAMLLKVADIYDQEVSLTIKRALALLEPLLILVLGLLIAGIIISVLLAVLNVNELAF